MTVMKDHVMEKKWKVEPPKEPEGVDMWMPVPLDFGPSTPTYDPMDIEPQSPTYAPW